MDQFRVAYFQHGLEQFFAIARALFTLMNIEIQEAKWSSFMNLTMGVMDIQMFLAHFQ